MLTEPTREKLKALRLDAFAAAWLAQQQDPALAAVPFDEPRSTPQNRPCVDGSKPAKEVGGVETGFGAIAGGPPWASRGGCRWGRMRKEPHGLVRRVGVLHPARGCNGLCVRRL